MITSETCLETSQTFWMFPPFLLLRNGDANAVQELVAGLVGREGAAADEGARHGRQAGARARVRQPRAEQAGTGIFRPL